MGERLPWRVPARVVFWALAAFVSTVLLVAFVASSPAQAASRIRAGNCTVYQTKVLDPIALAAHVHSFTGGTVTSNATTGFDLEAARRTSCKAAGSEWATSAKWYPTAQTFQPLKDTLYYRDPGDTNDLQPIPTDLRLLSHLVIFRGTDTSVRFDNCLAVDPSTGKPLLDSTDHESHSYDAGAKRCPTAFPYRIPQPAILIHWPKSLTSSTPVSMGNNQFGPASTAFHADYLGGNQPIFNDQLIDLCLNNVPSSVTVANPACGVGP
jgi:hypothetical protein